jgi:hypothetical protein
LALYIDIVPVLKYTLKEVNVGVHANILNKKNVPTKTTKNIFIYLEDESESQV